MPCTLCLLRSVPLALTDAVGDGIYVRRHHVQLVGLELVAQAGSEGIGVAAIELEDHLPYAVGIQPALHHVQRAPLPATLPLFHGLHAPFAGTDTIDVAPRGVVPVDLRDPDDSNITNIIGSNRG